MSQEVVHRWFIAVELGAEWPAWMTDLVGGGARRVVAQLENESAERFAERALGVAAATQGSSSVVVLCNERGDTAQLEARRRLIAGVTRRGASRTARRMLAAPARASGRLKGLLLALVGGRSPHRSGGVEVCFGAPETAGRAVARVA